MRIDTRDIADNRIPHLRRLWAAKYEFDLNPRDVDDLETHGFTMAFWNRPEEFLLGNKFLTEAVMGGRDHTSRRVTRRAPYVALSRETLTEGNIPGTFFNLITWRVGEAVDMWQEEMVAMSASITALEMRRCT